MREVQVKLAYGTGSTRNFKEFLTHEEDTKRVQRRKSLSTAFWKIMQILDYIFCDTLYDQLRGKLQWT